ncbi:SPFH domain-containing protein [Cellulosilyticum ruminicola]|uniref:SPFH domain-containing protein n=1 Tax=Cellulosilyticum ruminicola TaxID=425254 RepID=UPI0006D0D2A5|nr:SPFH domain-containing protein [Cellulosilyticum ruminicola]
MGFFKKQFLDAIQWLDESSNTLVYMFPMEDQEIQSGAQLTVRPGQVAIFVDQGQIADVFGPGMYELTTANLPLLADLKHWSFGFKSPFKSDVYFLNMKEFLDNKWGTNNPIWIPDSQYGQVQVRAHGTYAFKIENPVVFFTQVAGTKSRYTLENIREQLRSFIINKFADIIGSLNVTVVQLASNYIEIGEALQDAVAESFKALGLTLTHFTISNIGLPEEIEKTLKDVTSMNMLGSIQNEKLSKIQILKQLDIMEQATKNPGMNSMTQSGMGLGMGMQMAKSFADNMNQMNNVGAQNGTPQQQAQATPQGAMITCKACGHSIPQGSKFCPECGAKVEAPTGKKFCSQCGNEVASGAKFCPQCGNKVS